MSRLVDEIVSVVAKRVRANARTLQNSDAELRTVFHGPPIPYLREVLQRLEVNGGIEVALQSGESVVIPVLLPLDAGVSSPSVGASGVCSRDYLVSLRNTPKGKRWVALLSLIHI